MKTILTFLTLIAAATILSAKNQREWPSERSDYRDEITDTEVWRLTTDPEVEIIPDRIKDPWSPDGSRILFRSKRNGAWHLYAMAADGSKITRVTDRPTIYGVWSRSGKSLICAPLMQNDRYELHEVDVDTFASRRIIGPFDSKFGKLGVSPDGKEILFTRFVKQADGEKQDVLFSSFVNLDGTGFFDFKTETKHGRIGWIPGRMDLRRMKSSRRQYVVQPDGSGARLIGEGGHEYFTPDGQHMVICDPKGGDPSKWLGACSAGLYHIATGKRRDVTKALTWLGSHPAISPDGRFVAADNVGHSYPGAIVIVSLDESEPALRVLCYHHASWEAGHITHPTVHWSPDGTKMLFISDKDSPDKKMGDMYLAVIKQPEAPRQAHITNNRAEGPLLTWQPAKRHIETKEYVIMRSVPSPRPNLQRVFLDRTGVFEDIGVVPMVDTLLAGEHLAAEATTLTVESTEGFPKSGRLLLAGNHSMARPEIVTYAGKTETTFVNCQRGAEDTQAAAHWSAGRVISLIAMQFTDANLPDPKRQYYYAVRAREHSGLTSPYSRISNPAVVNSK